MTLKWPAPIFLNSSKVRALSQPVVSLGTSQSSMLVEEPQELPVEEATSTILKTRPQAVRAIATWTILKRLKSQQTLLNQAISMTSSQPLPLRRGAQLTIKELSKTANHSRTIKTITNQQQLTRSSLLLPSMKIQQLATFQVMEFFKDLGIELAELALKATNTDPFNQPVITKAEEVLIEHLKFNKIRKEPMKVPCRQTPHLITPPALEVKKMECLNYFTHRALK